ncbi:Maternal exuperantia [Paramuricea clavata]|uniref:Maternal exuperantia n=1 Tax=Paramuricea clavata TaxID=317549 RepID=A0A7D9EEH4_PARCT|nr:Maternal exuperantia [Paramuricea clavata]
MEEFCQMVVGFSDTLPALWELFPDRRSCSHENLAKDLLDSTYDAHNALGDVQMLHMLSSQFIGDQLLLRHSFSTSWFQEYTIFLEQKRANLQTFQPLLHSKAVSKGIADKMAASGLQYRHFLLAYQQEGNDGVSNVLMEKF